MKMQQVVPSKWDIKVDFEEESYVEPFIVGEEVILSSKEKNATCMPRSLMFPGQATYIYIEGPKSPSSARE